ncbi:MAG: hypothetical protein OEV33_06375 [Armatimonadota bacterium]|nr:hypothetical protein [Armatimonadota bacterium]
MKRTVIAAMTAVLLVAAVGMVLAQEAQPESRAVPELTADELAVLEQANDLQKQLEISQLELRLAELKEAPQGEIAERATRMYRLQGELHALRVKHPAVARYQWRERAQERWGRGRGRGRGGGPAWGQGGMEGHGRHGMGRGRGQGGGGRGQGPGMGRGRGHRGGGCDAEAGMGHGGGRGMGRHGGRGMPMSDSALDWIPPARNADVPTIGLEPEPEMLEEVG